MCVCVCVLCEVCCEGHRQRTSAGWICVPSHKFTPKGHKFTPWNADLRSRTLWPGAAMRSIHACREGGFVCVCVCVRVWAAAVYM